jgi:hypothetical protein
VVEVVTRALLTLAHNDGLQGDLLPVVRAMPGPGQGAPVSALIFHDFESFFMTHAALPFGAPRPPRSLADCWSLTAGPASWCSPPLRPYARWGTYLAATPTPPCWRRCSTSCPPCTCTSGIAR